MKRIVTSLLAIMMLVSIIRADSSAVYPGSLDETAWYLMNAPVGTETVADLSGNGYNAEMAWDSGAVKTSGYTGSSFNFTGDSVRIWTPANMGATGDFTWSVKIKTTQTTNGGLINHSDGYFNHDTGNQSLGLVNNGKARFYMEGKNWVQTEASLNDGQWHTITVVARWENIVIYVDGQVAALDYAFGEGNNYFPGLATASDSYKYWFGACHYGSFIGEMKDIRILDHEITDYLAQVIDGKTDADPNLVLRYKMDEATGQEGGGFKDSSLKSRNGNIAWDTPQSPRVSHFTGSSFSFENDTARTWASKTFQFSTSTPFTWAVWVKTTTGGTLINRCAESNPWGWNIDGYKQFSLTTSPQFEVAGLPYFAASGEYPATGTVSVSDGKWHHVAVTFDGLGTVKIYIDGQFNIAQGVPLQNVSDPTDYMFFFGLGAGIRYLGEMADLRIYDKELTADELSQMAWVGDFDGDRDVDLKDLDFIADEWLNDYTATPLVIDQIENGNFESYGTGLPLSNNWEEYYYAGTLGSGSKSQFSLITNPANAHSGSQALSWDYNSIDINGNNHNFTEIVYYFDNNLKNLGDYDQMRVWLKRHAGNSQENLLYVKFLDYRYQVGNIAAEAWLLKSDGSTYANPDEWHEWDINLDGMIFKNGFANASEIDDVTGIIFGVSDDEGTGGTGKIDIDDITLVKLPTCSAQKDQDLNKDCAINFVDFVIFAQNWLMK
jgi:hypothetical protein